MSFDEHIMETTGRAKVVIRDGRVAEVGKPLISECPLAKKFSSPVISMNEDEIRGCIEERIRSYGMFTADRDVLSDDDFVLFGASEILSNALKTGFIDCAVIACDGAGTVIAKNPLLVQGIGGRMSGLVRTSPFVEVIDRIEANGGYVPFPEDARINQYGGVNAAYEIGLIRVAVTIANPADSISIRNDFPDAIIIAVHTTGLSDDDASILSENCDLVYRCASAAITGTAAENALAQFGKSVPVYAFTKKGKEIVFRKLIETQKKIFATGALLPVEGEERPSPLI